MVVMTRMIMMWIVPKRSSLDQKWYFDTLQGRADQLFADPDGELTHKDTCLTVQSAICNITVESTRPKSRTPRVPAAQNSRDSENGMIHLSNILTHFKKYLITYNQGTS